MPRLLAVTLLLTTVAGCSAGTATSDTSESSPAKTPAAEPEGKTITLSLREPTPPVHPGDRLVVELRAASMGVDPKYRHEWGDARVTGAAIRFDKHETIAPPADIDGGSATERYEFVAVAAGEATIAVPVRGAGDESDANDFSITVTVAAPSRP
jgi:hypothetical protein